MSLIKCRTRVADHGEVFTPPWLVNAMLDLVKDEASRIESRFLEPACGSGNFLVQVLQRKLSSVERQFGRSVFHRRHYAIVALMSLYGIELLPDNTAECQQNMLGVLKTFVRAKEIDETCRAALHVLHCNIICGDALAMQTHDGKPIVFAEWSYLGKGRFQRRDFRFDALVGTSSMKAQGSLFAASGHPDVFMPLRSYPVMTMRDLAVSRGDMPEAA